MRIFASFVISLQLISTTLAQEQKVDRGTECVHAPTIIKAANFLLTEPVTKSIFRRNLYGADAAYLKLHYGTMSYDAGLSFLNELGRSDQPPPRLQELQFAYASDADRLRLYDNLPKAGPGIRPPIAVMGPAGWRAAIIDGQEDWLLARFAEWQASDPYGFAVDIEPLSPSLLDMDDELKLQLSRKAEKLGITDLAIGLLTTLYDLQPLVEILDRSPTEARWREQIVRSAGFNGLQKSLFEIQKQPIEIQQENFEPGQKRVFELIKASPEAFILYPLLLNTGDMRLGTVVAESMLAGIAAGALDPITDPDKSVAVMVTLIGQLYGGYNQKQLLERITSVGPGRPSEKAIDMIDRALARHELRPFFHDPRLKIPPAMPTSLSRDFPWSEWTEIAVDLKNGKPIKPESKLVAADLLAGAGLEGSAVATLASDGSLKARQRIYELMLSLDLRCAKWLSHPIAIADPFYRFDQN